MTHKAKRKMKPKNEAKSMRASVSFPPELYDTIEQIAKEKKVSVAWVIRDATDKYVSDRWPLLTVQR